MIMQILAPLLLFLPGVALIHLLNERLKLRLNTFEVFLAGAIIWNYIVVIIPLISGVLNLKLTFAFIPLTLVSIALVGLWVGLFIWRRKFTFFHIPKLSLWVSIHIALIWVFLALITIYHPLYYEADALIEWLPNAKSILITDNFYSIFRGSYIPFSGTPAMSIIYAWNLFLIDESPRVLPFIYFVITALAVFELAKRISSEKYVPLMSVVAFSSFIYIVRYLGTHSLLLDLPFMFYSTVAVLFTMKAVTNGRKGSIFFALIAGCLALLTKALGLVVLSCILACLILFLIQHKWISRCGFLIAFTSVFSALALWNLLFYPKEHPMYFTRVSIIVPVLALSLPLFFASFFLKNTGRGMRSFGKLEWALFFLPLLPAFAFTGYYFLVHGFSLGFGPGLEEIMRYYNMVRPITPAKIPVESLLDFFRWEPLFLSIGLGGPYILPIVVGLGGIFKRFKDRNTFIFISFFALLLMIWSFFFQNQFELGEYRRLLYFTPLVAILVAKGVCIIFKHYKLAEEHTYLLFAIFNSFVLVYAFSHCFPNDIMRDISYSMVYSMENMGLPDVLSYNLFILMFITVVGLGFLCKYFKDHNTATNVFFGKVNLNFGHTVILAVFLVSQIALASSVIAPVFGYVTKNSWNPSYYNDAQPETWQWSGEVFEIVNYYRNNIRDNYSTLSFGTYYLAYYTNRTVFDLNFPQSYPTVMPVLRANTIEEMLQALYDANIRYFLIPEASYGRGYGPYREASTHFPLFKAIKEDEHFVLLQSFTHFKLYKLLSPQEYTEYVDHLKKLFYYEREPYVISDDSQFQLYYSNKPEISIADASDIKIAGQDALKIEVFPYYKVPPFAYIRHNFDAPLDLKNYDYVSFYWYGGKTGSKVFVVLVSDELKNQYEFIFEDAWTGWARVIVPLNQFRVKAGSPTWDNITAILFGFAEERWEKPAVLYLDRVTVDNGITDYYFIPLQKLKG